MITIVEEKRRGEKKKRKQAGNNENNMAKQTITISLPEFVPLFCIEIMERNLERSSIKSLARVQPFLPLNAKPSTIMRRAPWLAMN